MFGIATIGKMLGSEKAFGKVFDAASSAIDKAFYTREEQAGDAAKRSAQEFDQRVKLAETAVDWMKATSGQNLTRRILAISIAGIWLLYYVVSLAMVAASVFLEADIAVQLRTASSLLDDHIDDIQALVFLIITFYFGAPHVQGVIDGLSKRFTGGRKKSALAEGLEEHELQRLLAPKPSEPSKPPMSKDEIDQLIKERFAERDNARTLPAPKPATEPPSEDWKPTPEKPLSLDTGKPSKPFHENRAADEIKAMS